jgi:hypothetical protein
MDSIAIELTDACVLSCSNCTRFAGSAKKNFFMTLEEFKIAVDSLIDFKGIVGIQGAEPLLHPKFAEFCAYALSKIPRERLGLWSVFPTGAKYISYRKVICETFGQVLLNDHSVNSIMHGPLLVAIEEVIKDPAEMWQLIDSCWLQNAWSASINQKGAFFCEVAAARSVLEDGPKGWDVTSDWWKKTPKDFKEQMETWCPSCGCALPLERRASVDGRDDISPGNLERLKGKSRKVDNGLFVISDFKMDPKLTESNGYPDQSPYKNLKYRGDIAARYGIYLTINKRGFMEPHLMPSDDPKDWVPPPTMHQQIAERFGASL